MKDDAKMQWIFGALFFIHALFALVFCSTVHREEERERERGKNARQHVGTKFDCNMTN